MANEKEGKGVVAGQNSGSRREKGGFNFPSGGFSCQVGRMVRGGRVEGGSFPTEGRQEERGKKVS